MAGQLIRPPSRALLPVPSRQPSQAQTARQLTTEDWFSPLSPLAPTAPVGLQPRQFEYIPGQNLIYRPRADEAITFADLIYMADTCDLVRIVIESLKDQVCLLPWQIRVKSNPGETEKQRQTRTTADPRVKYWSDFLSWPNEETAWNDFLRMLLEDLFVLDAASILLQRTRKGGIGALRVIDGQTITRYIDEQGFTPTYPSVAYAQVLYGQPSTDLTTQDLVYRPRNRKARKLYGSSPVEQILLTLNIALRRSQWQLANYTSGNVPEALYTMPGSVTEENVKRFQSWFDQTLAGNLAARRRIHFIPGDDKGVNRLHFTKDQLIKDEADEWFARIICFAFRISNNAFIKMMNRATSQESNDAAEEVGITSVCQWICDTINYIIQKQAGDPDLEFVFSQKREADILKQAQVDQIYVGSGVRTRNQVRENLGDEPSEDPGANVLTVSGPVVKLDTAVNGPDPAQPGEGGNPNKPNEDTDEEQEEGEIPKQNTSQKGVSSFFLPKTRSY